MTARTSDSGISSIAAQLSEEGDREPPAGQAELDACLEMHLTYCLSLLQVRRPTSSAGFFCHPSTLFTYVVGNCTSLFVLPS